MNNEALSHHDSEIHMGNLVRQKFEQSGLSRKEFAKGISCVVGHVHKIFARKEIDVSLLKRISRTLKHDFFQHYSAELHPEKGKKYMVRIEFYAPKKPVDATSICQYCKADRSNIKIDYL